MNIGRDKVQLPCMQIDLLRFVIRGLDLPSYHLAEVYGLWYDTNNVSVTHWHRAWWDSEALMLVFHGVVRSIRSLYIR